MDANPIIVILREWLETLSTEDEWWDGCHMSDRDMATSYILQFAKWLTERKKE